ncbi:MAG: hypothetical protein M1826_001654 [Phylliscum demangeonii]|nr:MAG: hypothetical protein M1826_001654 [Phylliscum demangeonii]
MNQTPPATTMCIEIVVHYGDCRHTRRVQPWGSCADPRPDNSCVEEHQTQLDGSCRNCSELAIGRHVLRVLRAVQLWTVAEQHWQPSVDPFLHSQLNRRQGQLAERAAAYEILVERFNAQTEFFHGYVRALRLLPAHRALPDPSTAIMPALPVIDFKPMCAAIMRSVDGERQSRNPIWRLPGPSIVVTTASDEEDDVRSRPRSLSPRATEPASPELAIATGLVPAGSPTWEAEQAPLLAHELATAQQLPIATAGLFPARTPTWEVEQRPLLAHELASVQLAIATGLFPAAASATEDVVQSSPPPPASELEARELLSPPPASELESGGEPAIGSTNHPAELAAIRTPAHSWSGAGRLTPPRAELAATTTRSERASDALSWYTAPGTPPPLVTAHVAVVPEEAEAEAEAEGDDRLTTLPDMSSRAYPSPSPPPNVFTVPDNPDHLQTPPHHLETPPSFLF